MKILILPGKRELGRNAEGQISNSADILRPRPENHPFPPARGEDRVHIPFCVISSMSVRKAGMPSSLEAGPEFKG